MVVRAAGAAGASGQGIVPGENLPQEGVAAAGVGDCFGHPLQVGKGCRAVGLSVERPALELGSGSLRAPVAGSGRTAIEQQWLDRAGETTERGWGNVARSGWCRRCITGSLQEGSCEERRVEKSLVNRHDALDSGRSGFTAGRPRLYEDRCRRRNASRCRLGWRAGAEQGTRSSGAVIDAVALSPACSAGCRTPFNSDSNRRKDEWSGRS